MFVWKGDRAGSDVRCPFCWKILPDYLTRLLPETTSINEDMSTAAESSLYRAHRQPLAVGPSESLQPASPFVVEFFMVQGAGFQCMAYRNGDGKWREAFHDDELPGVIRVLE